MDLKVRKMFRERMRTPEELEIAVEYVAENLRQFLKIRERVLICLPDNYGGVGWVIGQAVERCQGIPTYLGSDRRWKTMMRMAFSSRCGTIVAEPLVLLGLSKLAKAMGVPLFIRNAILTGYPCMRWIREGIQRGLDCKTFGCFDAGGVVAGFICHQERTLWVRQDKFDVCTVDEAGQILPDGEAGEICLFFRDDPQHILNIEFLGKVNHVTREDGTQAIGLTEMSVGRNVPADIAHLSGHLHRWTSILDCRVTRGSYGLEMEIVTFPGEKLPKLPTCAKQVVRPWDPETEIPFELLFNEFGWDSH